MRTPLSQLLDRHVRRIGLPLSRISVYAKIPKQTLFNWRHGRAPRWHPGLPDDLARLSRALGLSAHESEELLLAAGCNCAVQTPEFEGDAMGPMKMPRGWIRAGSHPAHYDMGVDPEALCGDLPTAALRSRTKTAEGFGTLMQMCKPGKFAGERVRFSARTRTNEVEDWAGLWFRVDGSEPNKPLSFDNMQDRSLKGSLDWTPNAVVLDVPHHSTALAFGVLLSGAGGVWIADVRLEIVGLDVPSTNLQACAGLHDAPVNLELGP